MWIWRVEPSPSRSPRTISTLIFTRQLGISLANVSIHDVFLPQLRSKMFKMDASVANLKGKICGSDDIPLGCLIVRCLFIIEIIRGWYSWVVTQTRRQLIFLLSTENCGFRMLMWTPRKRMKPQRSVLTPARFFFYSMIIPIMWRYLSNNSHTNEMKVDQTRFHAVHFHLSHSTIRLPKVININKLSRFPLFW